MSTIYKFTSATIIALALLLSQQPTLAFTIAMLAVADLLPHGHA